MEWKAGKREIIPERDEGRRKEQQSLKTSFWSANHYLQASRVKSESTQSFLPNRVAEMTWQFQVSGWTGQICNTQVTTLVIPFDYWHSNYSHVFQCFFESILFICSNLVVFKLCSSEAYYSFWRRHSGQASWKEKLTPVPIYPLEFRYKKSPVRPSWGATAWANKSGQHPLGPMHVPSKVP